ncbi:MAG: hypothetical protein M1294_14295 [Firmicutes bacterium]|uniref:Uncharacterized protein n=1 Tax=Sulfobacillus benefaciens TaxID=453960 RepID=A0A2T2X111_9FIRM|nr:hypothetical protein [Bacillota bacterium]MCL5015054.1 hypothetical protein [Bacillota bacterium]PSR28158.1 MAG: hypothetical protein C7B43_10575 [Sulfobacillus benefaciens]
MQLIPRVVVVNKNVPITLYTRPSPQPHAPIHPVPIPFTMAVFQLPPWIVPDSREWQRNLPQPDGAEDN